MNYFDDKNKKILSEESNIPDVVSIQAKAVFSKILSEEKEKNREKEYITMRKFHKKRFVLLVAAIVMVAGTTAFAAVKTWGLPDFFSRTGNELPNAAEKLVQTDIEQETDDTADVNFKVREAVCDGQKIYVVLEAKPVDTEKYLLLTMDVNSSDSVANLGITTDKYETITEYALENRKEMIYVNAGLSNNGTNIPGSVDFTTEEDGTLVIMYKADNTFNSKNLKITCNTSVSTVDQAGHYGKAVKGAFDFQLTDESSESTVSYNQTEALAVAGVIVDKIELSKTELGIYTELTFHIAPDATPEQINLAKDGLWFEYLDAGGKRWESGLDGSDTIEKVSDGVYVQKNSFKTKEIPGEITVRGYDCWEKTRFGSITLEKE